MLLVFLKTILFLQNINNNDSLKMQSAYCKIKKGLFKFANNKRFLH